MKLKNTLFSLALVGTTALVTATVLSQDHPGQDGQERSNPMMEPGKQHEKLDKFVGKWTYELKHWADPASEPHTMTGTSEYEWILGERYIKGTIKGEFDGHAFEGLEILGHDNMNDNYFSIWFDNFGTGYAISKGNEKDGKMVMTGTMDDPMSGMKGIKTRSVGTSIDENTHKYEMFVLGPEGGEMKVMEIISKRAK